MKVAVLGASNNPERYSHKAILALLRAGHDVVPINPALKTIENIQVVASLDLIKEPVDTVTVYVSEKNLEPLLPGLKKLRPRRVIFNPGAEAPAAAKTLQDAGIEVVEACTLVMLSTRQF